MEVAAQVYALLNNVPKDYAQILLLADVHEFSYKEIAEIAGADRNGDVTAEPCPTAIADPCHSPA